MGWFGPKDAEKAKRAKVREYFEPEKSSGAVPFLCLGTACTLTAFLLLRWQVPDLALEIPAGLGLTLLAIGALLYYLKTLRATDDEIDTWRDEDLEKIIKRVPELVEIDRQQLVASDNPIVIVGFVRFERLRTAYVKPKTDQTKSWRFRVKVGKDGMTRWTPPTLLVLHHTANQLIAYQCDTDLRSGQVENECIEEFFWKDIVSLQIEKESISWADAPPDLIRQWAKNLPKKRLRKYQALLAEEIDNPSAAPHDRRIILRLRTTAGCALEVVLSDGRFVEPGSDPADFEGTWEHANTKAIARLRKMLRELNQPAKQSPPVKKVYVR